MQQSTPRIVIVGVCGSGKTVLANALLGLGYNARAMAQEHSFVPGMWRAHGQPNTLLYLDAEVEAINRRLGRHDWTAAAVAEQRGRLADAYAYCDLYLATDALDEAGVLERVVAFLREGWPPNTDAVPDTTLVAENPPRSFLEARRGNKRSNRVLRRRP